MDPQEPAALVPARQPGERLPLGEHQVHDRPGDPRGRPGRGQAGHRPARPDLDQVHRRATRRTASATRRSTSGGSSSSARSTGWPRSASREPTPSDGEPGPRRRRRRIAGRSHRRAPARRPRPRRHGPRALARRARAAGSRHRLPPRQLPLPRRAGRGRARRDQRRHRAGSATSTGAATSSTTRPTSTGSARGTPSTGGCSRASTGAATSSAARSPGSPTDRHAVRVEFAHDVSVDADLLVCADGVGSPARAAAAARRPAVATPATWRGGGCCRRRISTTAPARLFDDAITYFVYANSHILAVPDPRAGRLGAPRRAADQLRVVPQLPRRRRPRRPDDRRRRHPARGVGAAGRRCATSTSPRCGPWPAARLPERDRRRRRPPSSGRSCRWCSTWRCRGWRSDGSASSATRRGSCGPTPRRARRRRPPTGGRSPTRSPRTTTSPARSPPGSRASSPSAASCSTGPAASVPARRSTATGCRATPS